MGGGTMITDHLVDINLITTSALNKKNLFNFVTLSQDAIHEYHVSLLQAKTN